MSQKFKVLWADDEIDLLKPHLLFLEGKGCVITTVNSGIDAIEEVENTNFDVVFLDEMMPGMTGLETLQQIKQLKPQIPVVMKGEAYVGNTLVCEAIMTASITRKDI